MKELTISIFSVVMSIIVPIINVCFAAGVIFYLVKLFKDGKRWTVIGIVTLAILCTIYENM